MAKIADHVVTFYPSTHEVVRENPPLPRAVETRAKDPKQAMNACGIGRIKWPVVESYTKKDLKDFQARYEIGNLLATNAKTLKPRPSGRHGVIRGLNVSPHFYPNLLTQIDVDDDGHLARFERRWFNSFDGSTPQEAAKGAKTPARDLLNFCVGSSQWCRQTCLVLTGQHPSTLEASRAKMKFTWGLLEEPELFVALLHKQLGDFARAGQRNGYDAVCRLNMLSDLPWYSICPELLEAHEGQVFFYDYTKLPCWRSPDYRRIAHLLDLTFSFSGSNDSLCTEALKEGHRIAVVFAPADAGRRATVAQRTTWQEIKASGLVDDAGRIALFGGKWEIVDGDESDYRVDDPAPSIVALNFKEPTAQTPRLTAALPESRARFGVSVPDPHGVGQAYADARSRKKLWKDLGVDPSQLPVDEVVRLAAEHDDPDWATRDADDVDDAPVVDNNVVPEGVGLAMAPVTGTKLLVGPHVPTVLND